MAILATTLDSTVKMTKNPRRLLYIFENQPWEAALLSAWRRHHDVPLIAVPHSTVRFWDLRYFVSVDTIGDPRFARADVIAANSPAARASLIDGGWPGDLVAEVEALMYQYLGEPDTTRGSGNDIVVLGELDSASTQRYLRFLDSATAGRANSRAVVFKAHPLVDPATIDLAGMRVETTTEHLSTLLRRARVLVTGASGSTTLESLSRGIPTICVLDPSELDLSSIDQHPLLRLVGTATEFHEALTEFLDDPPLPTASEPMFHTDAALGRWRALLGAVDSRK
jgi:surface carbohydrate biosynthesis protein (TIGR04326 family)